MGLFKSLKGDLPESIGNTSTNTATQRSRTTRRHDQESYAPPPGPPPSHSSNEYVPPPGPPPSHRANESVPPPGPPPPQKHGEYQPPPGPPPSHQPSGNGEPPPYHDWTSIPDTALLPPPPALGHQASPSSNASLTDAVRAHEWCRSYPLIPPHEPTYAQITSVRNLDFQLVQPREYNGSLRPTALGSWTGSTRAGSKDSCLLTSLPLYFAQSDSPYMTESPKTIYFEVRVDSIGRRNAEDESSIAVGYCAVPYPTWRMPGWERGSLAVHSDDGRRYVNDTDGGKDFTAPIRAGDTVGMGITYSIPRTTPDYRPSPVEGAPLEAEIFFTRNGSKDGGWNLHEELDAESEFGVFGLDGKFDLYGAIGIFGEVGFKASFNRRDWLWQPR